MVKEIITGSEGREQLKRGINILADAVKVTLGPKGKNVLLDKNYSTPHITKDGVTVATNIFLDERIENMGCTMLKDIAKKTAEEAGDGTTTSIVLAQALYNNGLREIEQNKFNSIEIQKGMQKAAKDIVDLLRNEATPIETKEDLYNVAFVSANGDTELAKMISDITHETGAKGNIIVNDSKTYDTYYEFVEGIQFDSGYMSYHFSTDTNNQKVEFDNPLVLVSLDKISGMGPISQFVEYAYKNNRPIVIVTEELVGEALAVLAANAQSGKLKVCVVSAPGYANNRKELLEDMAVTVGGKLLGNNCGNPFHMAKLDSFGTCQKVIINRNNTTFFVDEKARPRIEKRIEEIEGHKLLNDKDRAIRVKFDDRIAALRGKVAVINVAGFTETEVKEKKDRIDDAIRACQSALEEGIVPGSGITYINIARKLVNPKGTEDFRRGYNIVINSVSSIFNQVAVNCGLVPEVILNNIDITLFPNRKGYNFRTNEYCNLKEDGVIDPVKVLRVALENAVSITCQLLTTEAIVKNKLTEFDLANIAQPKNMVNPIYH